ncbi:MAG: hypothetical protein ACRDMJ_03040 [Solirubrobacteraceae bacterium]
MRRTAVVAAVGVTALGMAAAAGAAIGGNPNGVKLARQVNAAYAKVSAVTVSESGFVTMRASQGRVSSFNWAWGTGGVPHGWVSAREREVAALAHGRLVWWRDDLTPPPCGSGICSQVPVEVVVDRAGAFFAFGSAAHHGCYGHLHGSTPVTFGSSWTLGEPWGAEQGTLAAPVTGGRSPALTSTYPWGRQRATETDVMTAATDLVRSATLRIVGAGRPALNARARYGYPAKAPAAPLVKLCG